MTYPRTILLNDPDDVVWLVSTHLKHNNPPAFLAFVLSGNEDCPVTLELYKSQKPDYNEKPVMVYKLGEGKAYAADRPETIGCLNPKSVTLVATAEGVGAVPYKPLTLAERLKLKGLK